MYKVEENGDVFTIVYIEYGEKEVISEDSSKETAEMWCDKLNDAFGRGYLSDR